MSSDTTPTTARQVVLDTLGQHSEAARAADALLALFGVDVVTSQDELAALHIGAVVVDLAGIARTKRDLAPGFTGWAAGGQNPISGAELADGNSMWVVYAGNRHNPLVRTNGHDRTRSAATHERTPADHPTSPDTSCDSCAEAQVAALAVAARAEHDRLDEQQRGADESRRLFHARALLMFPQATWDQLADRTLAITLSMYLNRHASLHTGTPGHAPAFDILSPARAA